MACLITIEAQCFKTSNRSLLVLQRRLKVSLYLYIFCCSSQPIWFGYDLHRTPIISLLSNLKTISSWAAFTWHFSAATSTSCVHQSQIQDVRSSEILLLKKIHPTLSTNIKLSVVTILTHLPHMITVWLLLHAQWFQLRISIKTQNVYW